MQFNTTFNFGDKGWVYSEHGPRQLTIGQVRVQATCSKGYEGSIFGNYQAQEGYEESYMCEETGVGSGTIWRVGQTIFVTEEECIAANAEHIEQERQYRERQAQEERERAQRRLLAAQAEARRLGVEGA